MPAINVLTPLANEDLIEISDYWESAGELQQTLIIERLLAGMRRIAQSPALGHPRWDLTRHPFLFFLARPYFIIYNRHTSPVQIIRILHVSRDVGQLLE